MPPYSYYTTTAGTTSYTCTTANTTTINSNTPPYYTIRRKMLIASKTVHCLREYKNFLKALHEDGYQWADGDSLISDFVPDDRDFPFDIDIYEDKTVVYN